MNGGEGRGIPSPDAQLRAARKVMSLVANERASCGHDIRARHLPQVHGRGRRKIALGKCTGDLAHVRPNACHIDGVAIVAQQLDAAAVR